MHCQSWNKSLYH